MLKFINNHEANSEEKKKFGNKMMEFGFVVLTALVRRIRRRFQGKNMEKIILFTT